MNYWWTLFIVFIIALVVFGIYVHFRLQKLFLRLKAQEKKEKEEETMEEKEERESSCNEPKVI